MSKNISARVGAVCLAFALGACGSPNNFSDDEFEPKPANEALVERAPRALRDKSSYGRLASTTPVERIVVKFHEGTSVRLRGSKLEAHSEKRSIRDTNHMRGLGISEATLTADLARAQTLLGERVRRLFSQKEEELEASKLTGEAAASRDLADLNLYFEVPVARGQNYQDVAELIGALNQLQSVELAYAQPPSEPAQVDIPPTTPNFETEQGYLNAAPGGIDARYAWTIPGGNGAGVRIVDIEGDWRVTHEDMPPLFHQGGAVFNNIDWRNHGTAVLGVMVGAPNAYGVTGISFGATAGYESIGSQSTASAIANAATAVGQGGVVLIELHAPGPAGTVCTCNFGQCGYIAMEYWQAEFDAIATASANGVIVVEAAGNGSANLDDARYGGLFNRNVRDSGAIVVGAGDGAGRNPTCWTNHGSRVDVFGWGEGVTTLGYGFRFNPGDENQYYTGSFNGTSSASPVVVGSVANVQGVMLAEGRAPLATWEMRNLLARTGTPQASGAQPIGRMPNLRAAIDDVRRNLAAGRPTSQSSTGFGGASSRAVDGNRNGNWAGNSVSHTNFDVQAWWQVDLGSVSDIGEVVLYNRTDCCGDRLANFDIRLSNDGVNYTTAVSFNGVAGVRTVLSVASSGRYVQVRLRGTNYLQLAEVEVRPPQNLAIGRPASQSSTILGADARRATDGNTDGNWGGNSVSHTDFNSQAWWQVDLGAVTSLRQVVVYNRTDCCSNRLSDFNVRLSNDGVNWTTAASFVGPAGTRTAFAVSGSARFVRIQLQGTNYLHLAEVAVYRP